LGVAGVERAQCNGGHSPVVSVSPATSAHFWLVLTPRALPYLFHQVDRERTRGHHWTK
jgi:hypothetical protein